MVFIRDEEKEESCYKMVPGSVGGGLEDQIKRMGRWRDYIVEDMREKRDSRDRNEWKQSSERMTTPSIFYVMQLCT